MSRETMDHKKSAPEQTSRGHSETILSDKTNREYSIDWTHFTEWCDSNEVAPLPADPQMLSDYLFELAERGYALATIKRRMAGIRHFYTEEGYELSTGGPIHKTLTAIKRQLGPMARNRKRPFYPEELSQIVSRLPADLRGSRDRALLLVGFYGAFHSSELADMQVAHLVWSKRGALVRRGKSEREQPGHERLVPIPFLPGKLCPATALKSWLAEAGITEGRVFRSVKGKNVGESITTRSIARTVKRGAKLIGLDPAGLSGHSLRLGFLTYENPLA